MKSDKEGRESLPLCLADIVKLISRSKKILYFSTIFFGLLGLFYAMTRPIKYQAEGTFREKGTKNAGISSQLYEMFSSGSLLDDESEAMTMIKSRKFLAEIIRKRHLQGSIQSCSDKEGLFQRFKQNMRIILGKLKARDEPSLKDSTCFLRIQDLVYDGEVNLSFLLTLHPDDSFELYDVYEMQTAGQGHLGEALDYKGMKLILAKENSDPLLTPTKFELSVDPISKTFKTVEELLEVETVKNDKTLLKLTFLDRDRKKSADFLNSVMFGYQRFIQSDHESISNQQIDYLNMRREDLTDKLYTLIQKHANFLSGDLYSAGFIDTNKEMEFLALRKQEYKQKLFANELEVRRLSALNPNAIAFYDRYSLHEGDPGVINSILAEMRALKQLRDSFQIELQKSAPFQEKNHGQNFEKQFVELKTLQEYTKELGEISLAFKEGKFPDQASALFNDPRFILKAWFERLDKARLSDDKSYKKTRESLEFYLNNLHRLFGVHKQILQERLSHEENAPEYQGVTLEAAKELYLDYSKQLVRNEGTIRQNLFFINQVKDPSFEITSLSASLSDPISKEMIQKASELVLNLRDQNNQSLREQERIKEELNLQRTFLVLHLQQMVQLMELSNQLIQEKIYSLQKMSLDLIHQQISLQEKNLDEYIVSRLQNLGQERTLLEERLDVVHKELAFLPDKWVSEKLLQQEVDVNQSIVEEIAKMVESKNIVHNLEVIQSAPVDIALVPLHPQTPKILIWVLAGLFLGAILALATIFIRAILSGLNVSSENLKSTGIHFSGSIVNGDFLETGRKILAYFTKQDQQLLKEGRILLLMEGEGPDYSPYLANLLMKRGCSVLRIDIAFKEKDPIVKGSLLDYLEKDGTFPIVQKTDQGDFIFAGGGTLFGPELIASGKFQQLLVELKKKYQWIILTSKAVAFSAECDVLCGCFPDRVITLKDEKIEEIADQLSSLDEGFKGKTAFVLA